MHTEKEILRKIASGELDPVEGGEQLAKVRDRELILRVAPKGGLSLYGLQRHPVTLYAEQWERILDFADEIREAIKKNEGKLRRYPKEK